MKTIPFYIALCSATLLTACAKDNLVDTAINDAEQPISLTMHSSNAVKGSLQGAGHYEFGVWGTKGTYDAYIFNNYLVAYADSDTPYKDYMNTSTWGDKPSAVDGLSYWIYEGLGSKDNPEKSTKSANEHQMLKFWDYSKDAHRFYAMAPYQADASFAADAQFKGTYTFGSLRSFYMEPVYPETATLNDCEALYTLVKTVAKASYGSDVSLVFKHLNAQIRLAFYTDINSKVYTVSLNDMVPSKIDWKSGDYTATIAAQPGVVLTPASQAQTTAFHQPADAKLAKYANAETGLSVTTDGVITKGTPTNVNDNLYFKTYAAGYTLPTLKDNATVLPTTYYTLPSACADTTGFTLHVSYTLNTVKSETVGEGIAIQVYDARVWIPAAVCQWQPGYCYTYYFKITDGSNGTTDPDACIDPADPDQPYVDPRDPRIIETGALRPIIFDEVTVTPYEELEDIVISND